MFLRIRKELFGYVVFDRFERTHYFIHTGQKLEDFPKFQLISFLQTYYPNLSSDSRIEFIFPREHSLALSAPIALYLEISSRCNFHCAHCYKPTLGLSKNMDLHQLRKLIDELHDIGVFEIRLCGNEPTSSPLFFEICRYILSKNLFLGINTNGYFSNEYKENSIFQDKIIALQPDFIVISIDGDKDAHDSIRKSGSYDSAISFLQKLSHTNIKRRINMILSKKTMRCIEHIGSLAYQNGCGVSFLPLRSIGVPTAFKNAEFLDKSLMLHAVEKIMDIRLKYPHTTFLTYFDILGDKALYHHSMDFNKPCPARKNGFIAYNGDFFPCDFLRYLGDKFLCGNVTSQSLWWLWTSSLTLRRFQSFQHEKCGSCKHYLQKCYGGCICGSAHDAGHIKDELCFMDLIQKTSEVQFEKIIA